MTNLVPKIPQKPIVTVEGAESGTKDWVWEAGGQAAVGERSSREEVSQECDSEALLRSPLALPKASADRKDIEERYLAAVKALEQRKVRRNLMILPPQ